MRLQLEQDRLEVMEETQGEQIEAQQEQIHRLEEMVTFNRDRLESMQVTAPVAGVLAPLDIPLQEGQWVQSGQQLSRVVVPGRLKAEIRIPQTQAQDIVVGQQALIDTRTRHDHGPGGAHRPGGAERDRDHRRGPAAATCRPRRGPT